MTISTNEVLAAMPIYGKNLKKSSSPETRLMTLKLSM